MSETTEFPLPYDVTAEERETVRREIAKHTQIVGEADRAIRFVGERIGQTGPVWHFQYTRLYRLPNGYLAAGRDMHEGMKIAFAADADSLAAAFENPLVGEFVEDELRFRGVIGSTHGRE
ncbi:MAG TPA: hypothetical protein VFM06_00385 [Candidatus Limnocylindria bacterium]|nr:hypothetical protein [Candidatus Limnocylindria bacterium]